MELDRIAGVVVLYNPDDDCLNNMDSYLDGLEKLYVVDNSSYSNESRLKKNSKITYLPNMENLGIAKALNIAATKAIEDGFLWMLTMDQDSKFDEGAFTQYVSTAKKQDLKNIAIVSPWHKTNLKDEKPMVEVDYPLDIMTSGNLLNLSIYQELKGFKEWYFIDGVDMDYCFEIRIHKYKILRINTVELNHHLGDVEYINILGRDFLITNHNYIRRYYITRNYLYIKKLYSFLEPEQCDINARQRRWAIKILLFEKDKFRKIRSIFLGKVDYYRGVTGKRY